MSDASTITFFPTSLAFATNEAVNEGTAGKVVGLNYMGTLPLTVTSVTSSDTADFPVVQDGCSGATVATGTSCPITIAFTPTKTGTISATISVVDSASGSPQKFTVTGGGATAPSTSTTLTATPTSAALGSLFTLVASIKDASGNPVTNGSVTFVSGTGASAKQLGTVQVVRTVSGGGTIGTATYKTRFLPLGANSVTAKYKGGDAASMSMAATVTVTGKYLSSVVLSSSGVQGDYTLVGTVSGFGPVNPTGSVVFTDTQATAPLGTAMLDATTLKQGFAGATLTQTYFDFPTNATVADLNGDGVPDVLVAMDAEDNTAFEVFLGKGDGTFQAPISVPGTSYTDPATIVAADINGDGKMDVVLANNSGGRGVGIFLGNGDGTFREEVDYSSGDVISLGVADFNGDGILDIVAGYYEGTVDLLLGNGDGTFQNPVSTAVGDGRGLTVGDFNNDGKPDVVVEDQTDNGVDVLLGNGNGTFKAPIFTATGSYPEDLVVADINGDGKQDIVTNDGTFSIGLLLGQGDGTFKGEQQIIASADGAFGQQAIGDLNGDGKLDLIVPDADTSSALVLLGNGDGTFQPQVSYSAGRYPIAVAVADLNNDGRLDFVTVNYDSGSVTVSLNRVTETATLTGVTLPEVTADDAIASYSGDTAYVGSTSNMLLVSIGSTTLTVTPTTGTLGTLFTLTATVVNGSGQPIAEGTVNFYDGTKLLASIQLMRANGVATYETHSLTVGSHSLTATFTGTALNKPTTSRPAVTVNVSGKYATSTTLTASGVQGSYALEAAVDGFGLGSPTGNVVFTDSSTNTILGTVPLTAAGLTSFAPFASHATGNGLQSVVSGDFNSDGKTDIAVANFTDHSVSILLGKGDGTFQTQRTYATASQPLDLVVGDFNGDGRLDIATSSASTSTISILIGNGDGTFKAAVPITVGARPEFIAAGDLNGDGKLDLVVSYYYGNIGVLLGNGDGTFRASISQPSGSFGAGMVFGDFNGDGKLDLAGSIRRADAIQILLGNGDGTFRTSAAFAIPNRPSAIRVGDINKDGNLDIVTTESSGKAIGILLGVGDGTFAAVQNYSLAFSFPDGLALADVNGDGTLDAVVSDPMGNTVSLLLGKGDGTFQTAHAYPAGLDPTAIVVADLNGDGHPDVVTANSNPAYISVLLGVQTEAVTLTGVTLPGTVQDNVVATYSGDTSFTGSTSGTLTLPSIP